MQNSDLLRHQMATNYRFKNKTGVYGTSMTTKNFPWTVCVSSRPSETYSNRIYTTYDISFDVKFYADFEF